MVVFVGYVIIVFFLFVFVFRWFQNKCQSKQFIPIEPGAVSIAPPAPTLRSQEVHCYKCEKYEAN